MRLEQTPEDTSSPEYFSNSQTETEKQPDEASKISPPPEYFSNSQTDSEKRLDQTPEDTPSPEFSSNSQTETEKQSNKTPEVTLQPGVSKIPQTENKSGKTKKQSQSDSTPGSPEKPPAKKRARSPAVVSIDDTRSVETSADKHNNDLLDLVESLKSKKILSGTIQGVERSADNPDLSYAVIYHGDFKVIIPAEQMVDPPADFRDRSPGDVMHYMITKRLGAEIDYIVKGVDKTGIAAASRLEAMARKRKDYYFGADRDGNNLLHEGINAEARVVSVIRAGIFVDLFGLEVYIPLRELSYQRGVDAALQFQPGQRVLVKILTIDRANRDNIQVTASVKQATENPYEKALRKYVAGSRYVGTVSMVDTNGVFVSLDGGVDCLCSYPKRGRPPRGSRVTVRIIGINTESNRIWGAITHMTTAR